MDFVNTFYNRSIAKWYEYSCDLEYTRNDTRKCFHQLFPAILDEYTTAKSSREIVLLFILQNDGFTWSIKDFLVPLGKNVRWRF